MTTLRSWFVTVSSIAVLFCLSSGTAFADLEIEGQTSGKFYEGTKSLGSVLVKPFGILAFLGSEFGPTSDSEIDLGTFHLAALTVDFSPFDFVLRVDFTAPAGAGTTFSADLNGKVSLFGTGKLNIDFANNSKTLTFGEGSGSFDLAINDLTIANGQSKSIKGTISNATFATPEPTSIVLISTLMGGALFLFRKRLRKLGNC